MGTVDNKFHKEKHTYFTYDIDKCHEEIRAKVKVDPGCIDSEENKCEMKDAQIDPDCVPGNGVECKPVDPKCETADKIDEWISKITVHFRVLDRRIDFNIDNYPVRENEIWLPSI